jgi:hypothetical protein
MDESSDEKQNNEKYPDFESKILKKNMKNN